MRRRARGRAVRILAALLGLAFATQAAESPIKIGLVLPPGEPEARSIQRGAEAGARLAAKESGAPVELLIRGTPGQWGTEGDDAVTLALDAGAQALLAPTTGTTVHLVEQVAGRTRIPVVSLCADTSVTGARIPWVLRVVPTTVDEARTLFATARTDAGESIRRWAALVPEGRAGREAVRDLGTAAKGSGVEIAQVLAVPAALTNADALVAQAVQVAPAGILIWVDPGLGGSLVRAARTAGYRGVLAGPGRLGGTNFLQTAGAAAEGFWSTRLRTSPGTIARRTAAAGAPNDTGWMTDDPVAAAAVDAVTLLAAVLREAGDRPAFTVLPLEGERPGVTGALKFDAVGNRIVNLEALVVRQGHFEAAAPTR